MKPSLCFLLAQNGLISIKTTRKYSGQKAQKTQQSNKIWWNKTEVVHWKLIRQWRFCLCELIVTKTVEVLSLWIDSCEGSGGSALGDTLMKTTTNLLDWYYFVLFQFCVNMLFIAYSTLFLVLAGGT